LWRLFNVTQERSLSALTGIRMEECEDGSIARKTVHGRKISSLDIDTKLNKQLFDLALSYVGA
jgi:allantoicase